MRQQEKIPPEIIEEAIARLKRDGGFENEELHNMAVASIRDAMEVIESLGGEIVWHQVLRTTDDE